MFRYSESIDSVAEEESRAAGSQVGCQEGENEAVVARVLAVLVCCVQREFIEKMSLKSVGQ